MRLGGWSAKRDGTLLVPGGRARRTPRVVTGLIVVGALAALTSVAEAYPQFQLSTGNARCSACHIAPAGGGLINDYGRSESSDTISQFGGEGAFLYGAYQEPDWLKLGVDLRSMTMVRRTGDENDVAIFPMQGDTYAAFPLGDVTLYAAVGPRAQVRRRGGFLSRFGAREYWAMWRRGPTGWYARLGRFMAPFGVRSQDHTLYVRRYLGFHAWEETHTASVGHVGALGELHVSAFTPVPSLLVGAGPGERGATAYYERRLLDDRAVLAGQARVGLGRAARRTTVGALGKLWWERPGVLFQAELDVTTEDFVARGSPTRAGWTGYASASWFPRQGWLVTAAFERHDPDVSVANLWRDAYTIALQWFPAAHWELMLEGKAELPGNYGRGQRLFFFQGHYYL